MTFPDGENDSIALLRRAASDEDIPDERRARVRARLARALQGAPLTGLPVDSTVETGGAVQSGAWKAFASRFLYWSAPALVVGVVAGASVERTLATARAKAAEVRPSAQPPSPAVLGAPSQIEPAAPSNETAANQPLPSSSPVAPSAPGNAGSSTLALERALLDQARASLVAGEPAPALSLVDRHARRYGQGALAEEREALAVNALATLGRREEAIRRGAAFRTRYPRSLLMPSVEAALAVVGTP